ncbi:MAG: hypothetical protein ACKVS5_05155 [Parvularculaceae bacterium]
MRLISIFCFAALASCASSGGKPSAHDAFFAALAERCGKAYEGRLVTTDAADADMAGARLVMEVRSCTADEIRIPFHVGEDHSRTWVVSRTGEGLRLKHDHRHEDGSSDVLTLYGGDTAGPGSATRQEFPADAYSKEMFIREGRAVSVDNVWAIEIDDARFAYELKRPNRFFRVEFDVTRPVEIPPAPWGVQ